MDASRSGSSAHEPPRPAIRRRLGVWRRRLEGPGPVLAAVAVLLALGLAWAAWAEVERIVRVEGRVIPAGRNQQIQHLEGGIVESIAVAEGQAVARGALLLTIDATSAGANAGETAARLISERIRARRLEAESRGADSLSLPADLAGHPAAEIERQLFRTRRVKHEQEVRVYQQQASQRAAELREVEQRRQRLAGELETARQRTALIRGLITRNAASQMELLDAQSREQRLMTEIGEAEGAVPKLRAAQAETEARIQEAEARARAEAQADLTRSLGEIDRLTQILTAQSDRVTRTEVRAPVAGIVTRIAVNTVGGVVRAGDTIVEITPVAETVLVEARARPGDRAELRAGLAAHVRITAYDVGSLGVLDGRVTEVSADTVADSKGDPYYRVVILVDRLPPSYEGRPLVPGMTLTGDVVIGRRTVLSYLTSPLHKFSYHAFRDAR